MVSCLSQCRLWRHLEVTHDHPEGIREAQAVAACIHLARSGRDKRAIRTHVQHEFAYRLDDIRQGYRFDVSGQGSVPQSIIAFLESEDWEDAIRNAVSPGGDADTMAAIAGSIAEAFYGGVPEAIAAEVMGRLDAPLQRIVGAFRDRITPAG